MRHFTYALHNETHALFALPWIFQYKACVYTGHMLKCKDKRNYEQKDLHVVLQQANRLGNKQHLVGVAVQLSSRRHVSMSKKSSAWSIW